MSGRPIVRVTPGGRVVCRADLALPASARQIWGQLRDFRHYAAHDYFHADFRIEGGVPRAGANLRIEHQYGPLRLERIGRIVRWREGEGFAFSDLSARGVGVGFPHVFAMTLRDGGPHACTLTLSVTGRWTAPTPRWVARLWLWWVFVAIVQRTRNDLLAFVRSRRT